MEIFHERIKIAMKREKISQSKLARLTNVKPASVWEWLNTGYQSLERFYQICDILNVSPNFLLGKD